MLKNKMSIKISFGFVFLFIVTSLLFWTFRSGQKFESIYPSSTFNTSPAELSLVLLDADSDSALLSLDWVHVSRDEYYCLSKIIFEEQHIKFVPSFVVTSGGIEDVGLGPMFDYYEHEVDLSNENICSDNFGKIDHSFLPESFQVDLFLVQSISPVYYPFDESTTLFLVTIEIVENGEVVPIEGITEIVGFKNRATVWEASLETGKHVVGEKESNLFFLNFSRPMISKLFTIVSVITLLIFSVALFFIHDVQSLLEALIALTLGIIGVKDLIQMPNLQTITFLDIAFISIYLLAAFLLMTRILEKRKQR